MAEDRIVAFKLTDRARRQISIKLYLIRYPLPIHNYDKNVDSINMKIYFQDSFCEIDDESLGQYFD